MIESGYIKLYRSLLDWEWYKVQNTKSVFLHLLLTANFEDKKWRGIVVKRGQRICSRLTLSAETGLSERAIRTALNHLKSTNEVTIESTRQYSIITVNNYDKFQAVTDQATSDRPTSDQPATNERPVLKKDKNIKKDKNSNPPIVPLAEKADIFEGRSFSEPMKLQIEKWLGYKKERKESYTPTGWKSFLTRIEKHLKTHSEAEVIDLMDECMGNNWQGVIWDRLPKGGTDAKIQRVGTSPATSNGGAGKDRPIYGDVL